MGTNKGFTKHDSGKLHWSKFAWGGAAWVLRIMEFGAAKYGWDNWRLDDRTKDQRFLDAAQRHMTAHFQGITIDPESGLPTLAHAACCLLFYLEDVKYQEEHTPLEDMNIIADWAEKVTEKRGRGA